MKTTRTHLEPAAILAYNAKRLTEAASRPESFRGPQMTEHRKPNAGGGACDVCGCNGLRVGVLHRALGVDEQGPRSRFVVLAQDYTGDWSERHLNDEGKAA